MSKCGPDGKITLASVYMTIFAPGSHPNNHQLKPCKISIVSLHYGHTYTIRITPYLGSNFSLRWSDFRLLESKTRPNGPGIRSRGSEIRKDRNPQY